MLVFQIEDLDVHAIAKEVLTSQILHALAYSLT